MEVKSSILFEAWKMFAEKIGERLRPQKDFNSDMEGKGFKQVRDKRGIWFKGLRLKPTEGSDRRETPEEMGARLEAMMYQTAPGKNEP
jgi:hypothetical protein